MELTRPQDAGGEDLPSSFDVHSRGVRAAGLRLLNYSYSHLAMCLRMIWPAVQHRQAD